MNWLDSFTKVHRLPQTFRAAMQNATRTQSAMPPAAEHMNRIGRPKMTWQETRDWLLQKSQDAARNR